MFRKSILRTAALLCAGLVATTSTAVANETFPNKPIRWLLGFPAGGASDLLARVVGQEVGNILGQQLVIENRPGASGAIAAGLAVQSPADGYTILLVSSSYINNIALGKKYDFEPLDDFAPIARLAIVPNVVVVPNTLEASSIQDFIELAKSRPGELNYASGGAGTGTHIGTELFKSMAGVDMTHVPYKGTPPALLDIIAGRVDVMFAGLPPTVSHIKAGSLKPLAVTTSERLEDLPDVPAVAEAVPGFEAITWYGLLAPKGISAEVQNKLNEAFTKALSSPHVKEQLANQGFIPAATSPEEFLAHARKELETNTRVAKEAGIVSK